VPRRGNHGEISQGQELYATFGLTNRFPQPLEIKQVARGCTCANAKLSKTHVEPGEQISLEVSWKTGKSRGHTGTNLQVIFQLADGVSGYKLLRIQGDIIPDILYDPVELSFVKTEVATEVVQFSPGRQMDFRISRVFCSNAAFTATLHGNNRVEVTFQPDKWLPEDLSEPKLIVETNSVNEAQIFIPLQVTHERYFQ
jgi:hypothetical protein